MSTAIVLTGGANLGAVQVGMLHALAEAGVRPDLVTGASVGALNAAWIATHDWPGDLDGLDRLWRGLRRADVFPLRPGRVLAGALGRANHLVDPAPISRLVESHLGADRFEQARIPFHAVATEVTTGMEVTLSSGRLAPALLASAALPGVFPPVTVEGHELMDGGVADNAPLSVAVEMGATEVWVCPTGYSCALPRAPRHPLAVTLHAMALLVQQRLIHEVTRYQDQVDLRVLPPLCPLSVGPMDFSRGAELIERAHRTASEWIAGGAAPPDQTRLLGFHRH